MMMILNATQGYALELCACLAKEGRTVSSKEISRIAGIPRDYLVQLAQLLRRAGIVEAQAGPRGGYRLAMPAGDISAHDVLAAVAADRGGRTGGRAREVVNEAVLRGLEVTVADVVAAAADGGEDASVRDPFRED